MSLQSSFHTTDELLIERAQLHELVDFFWKYLPYTRDEIYQKMSTLLCIKDAHISDMSTEQIVQIAKAFHQELHQQAPCVQCKYQRATSYGIMMCNHPDMEGAFWKKKENAYVERCPCYDARNIPIKGP